MGLPGGWNSTAELLNDIVNKATQADQQGTPILVYDHVGISGAWMAHLSWLAEHITVVKAIKVSEAAWDLAAWKASVTEAIFLSASVPDPKRTPRYAEFADTVAIGAAVAALVYVTLGRRMLVWGGHPAITPMIWVVARSLGVDYGQWVRLCQSRYFEDEFPEDNIRFQNVTYIDALKDRDESLRVMRERIFTDQTFQAAVFIGGMQGIVDEFDLLRKFQPTTPLLPITSTGGATIDVARRLQHFPSDFGDNLDYVSLFHRWLKIDPRENRFDNPSSQPSSIEARFWRVPKLNGDGGGFRSA